MQIRLQLNKSVEENASTYFNQAKKMKSKLEGATNALEQTKSKLESAKQKHDEKKSKQVIKVARKLEWYEKFRWFISSEGFLCIGGRDATSNEMIIKKHMDKDDVVFHTDMAGSPFFIIKKDSNKDQEITIRTLTEVAETTASYSKAWGKGLSSLEVFHVNPDQVSKEAQSGEYMSKGSFMIRGKTNYISAELKIAIGINEGLIIGGALSAISSQTKDYIVLKPGDIKTSDIAKKVKSKIGGELDEIMKFIPAGGSIILK